MDRWWDDPGASSRALVSLRPVSVTAGVGAALLAYHGVAKGELDPLSRSTLVDEETIRGALDRVDVDRVGEAFAVATRPVMGDAAGAYGMLLARSVHEASVESTVRLVRALTGGGVDWPSAVSRAACVHGVPARELGPVVKMLRAERVGSLALADGADRALMGYALRLGVREATPMPESVSKAERVRERTRDRDFDESEHPRSADGRFRSKPDQERPAKEQVRAKDRRTISDEAYRKYMELKRLKEARRKRQDRLAQARERAAKWAQFKEQQEALRAAPDAELQRVPVKRERVRRERVRAERERVRVRSRRRDADAGPGPQDPEIGIEDLPPIAPGFKRPGVLKSAGVDDAWFLIVPAGVMDEVLAHAKASDPAGERAKFSGLWLDNYAEVDSADQLSGVDMELRDAASLADYLYHNGMLNDMGELDPDYALVSIHGLAPFSEDDEQVLEKGAMLRSFSFLLDGEAFGDGIDVPFIEAYDEDGNIVCEDVEIFAPVIRATLANVNDFAVRSPEVTAVVGPGRRVPRGEGGLPHDLWFGKALERVRDREFDESDHPRDSRGRFRDKPDAPVDRRKAVDAEKYEQYRRWKQARLARMKRLDARAQAARERDALVGQDASREAEQSGELRRERVRERVRTERVREPVARTRVRAERMRSQLQSGRDRMQSAVADRDAPGHGDLYGKLATRMSAAEFSFLFFRDPVTGAVDDEAELLAHNDPDDFRSSALMVAGRPDLVTSVVDLMHRSQASMGRVQLPPSKYAAVPKGTEHDLVFEGEVFGDPDQAADMARGYLERDSLASDQGTIYVPWGIPVAGGVGFSPALRMVDTDKVPIIVLTDAGQMASYAADPGGFQVVPLTEDWDHTLFSFDELMARADSELVWDHLKVPERSDFFVRAFRLEKRQNAA